MSDRLYKNLYETYQFMLQDAIDVNKVWYHGAPTEIQKFSDDFVGNGTDQEGPGIYFTDNEEDAASYMRKGDGQGHLYTVHLNFKKVIPEKGKANKKQLIQLIQWAENYEEKLQGWDENPNVAIKMAMDSIVKYNHVPKDEFLQIYVDFYRHQPQEFVRNMVILGYDGFTVKRGFMNTTHAVVYNPKIIEVTDTY
jgi:hypothetical protein